MGLDDVIRIKNALLMAQNPQPLSNPLTVQVLESLAKFTNAARLHFSGNCTLLSTCLYFNLLQGGKIYSVKNTSSPMEGFDSELAEEMILRARMTTLAVAISLSKITEEILKEYP